jgi:hypothetical protein
MPGYLCYVRTQGSLKVQIDLGGEVCRGCSLCGFLHTRGGPTTRRVWIERWDT